MSASIEELTSAKERELGQLRLQQAQQAQNTITSLEKELQRDREHISKLESDFDYNLSILDSRDEELSHYESAFKDLKRVVNALVAENSELKVRLDGICKELEGSRGAQLELKAYYQSRIKEIHSRTDSYRRTKQGECDAEHDKLTGLQAQLERRLLELEQEAQCQHDQLLADFDQILKQRDREHQARVESLSSAHVAQESSCLQLHRALVRAQTSAASLQQEMEERLGKAAEQDREQKGKVRRLEAEVQAMEDRVMVVEEERDKLRTELAKNQEDFLRKHAEMDRVAREKEASLKAAKQLHCSREECLVQQCHELQSLVEQREKDWLQREAGLRQAVRDKEELLQRAHTQLAAWKACHEDQVKDFNKNIVETDLLVRAAEDVSERLRRDLHSKEAELIGVRGKLSQSVERVTALEASHAQQRLDWEGRNREAERVTYSKQEEALHQLEETKKELTMECQELRQKLEKQRELCECIETQRDAALATLHQHGIPCDNEVAGHMTNIRTLKTQNDEFRSIIAQMRAELEQLSDWSEQRGDDPAAESMPTADYVRYMEGEMRKLKSRNRDLAEQLQRTTAQGKPPTPNSARKKARSPTPTEKKQCSDHTPPLSSAEIVQHRSHLVALSDTIASLHREKAELENTSRELKGIVEHLQERLKEEQEVVYILKARQVPQTKLHEKLIQATHVIIALVRDKEQLSNHINSLLGANSPSSRKGSVETVHRCTQTLAKAVEYRELQDSSPSNPLPRPQQHPPAVFPEAGLQDKEGHATESLEGSVCQDLGSSFSAHNLAGERSPQAAKVHMSDTSLSSLKFTESSSMEGMSLEQVVEVLDRSLVELSPAVTAKQRMRHSTPDSVHADDVQLEMVGKEIKAYVKAGRIANRTAGKIQAKTQAKKTGRVRNYSKKDI